MKENSVMTGATMKNAKQSEIALSDFITKFFRDKLGLWYDEFRGVYGPALLNGAALSDGEMLLTLIFRKEKMQEPLRKKVLYSTVCHADLNFWIYCETREDSRRTIDHKTFATIIGDAVKEFSGLPLGESSRRAVALLSMEVRYDEAITNDPRDALEKLIGVKVDRYPEYRGVFVEEPGFTLFREPGVWWGQAMFDCRIEEMDLASRLRRELPTLPSQLLGTQRYWQTNGESYLRRIGLLARYF